MLLFCSDVCGATASLDLQGSIAWQEDSWKTTPPCIYRYPYRDACLTSISPHSIVLMARHASGIAATEYWEREKKKNEEAVEKKAMSLSSDFKRKKSSRWWWWQRNQKKNRFSLSYIHVKLNRSAYLSSSFFFFTLHKLKGKKSDQKGTVIHVYIDLAR